MKRLLFARCAAAVGCALVLQFPSAAIAKRQETVLHSFAGTPDGASPRAGLIDVKGTLYGTTSYGGTGKGCSSCGTVFALDPSTGAETTLYSFCTKESRKKLHGCKDAQTPWASLIDVKGSLYGTAYGYPTPGAVFRVDRRTGAEKVLYSFCSQWDCADGVDPEASLIDLNGMLYGTTVQGGSNGCPDASIGCGTVFALDPGTGAETVLHSFCSQQGCTDGAIPDAGLIDVGGTLYSTTPAGGTYDGGTVFAIDPSTGAETVIYSFCSQQNCADGFSPMGGLINVNGMLYGTTFLGGSGTTDRHRCHFGCGTVFAIDPSTGAETVVYSFCSQLKGNRCEDGANPEASLIDAKGTLYGTTYSGGRYDGCGKTIACGTVFSIDPGTGEEKVLHTFCSEPGCADGDGPTGSLIDVKDVLYGTTFEGGAYNLGTVFAITR
ncbi:MAG TPA: choice-of-anchor tandem repeat GloVer-containing protein [Rhizomicrobium sp.]|nr:choice-of-anchor tandem repeat GloVer-containing protein [Rhizomicrobium sp.]